jgi:hypothetical protein
MTINQIIGNNERKSKVDENLWKKLNEKYSGIENKAEETLINTNLETLLKYDNNGKPILELKPLTDMVVYIDTQKEYDTLMQVYDAGNWHWLEIKKSPIEKNYYAKYNTKTAIDTDKEIICHNVRTVPKRKILTLKEFYLIQKITQEIITELNGYYETNYPDRASKG